MVRMSVSIMYLPCFALQQQRDTKRRRSSLAPPPSSSAPEAPISSSAVASARGAIGAPPTSNGQLQPLHSQQQQQQQQDELPSPTTSEASLTTSAAPCGVGGFDVGGPNPCRHHDGSLHTVSIKYEREQQQWGAQGVGGDAVVMSALGEGAGGGAAATAHGQQEQQQGQPHGAAGGGKGKGGMGKGKGKGKGRAMQVRHGKSALFGRLIGNLFQAKPRLHGFCFCCLAGHKTFQKARPDLSLHFAQTRKLSERVDVTLKGQRAPCCSRGSA
eukprot:1141803-Pelagomonas_calceolata.AAC.4